jgi:hypothetical protein
MDLGGIMLASLFATYSTVAAFVSRIRLPFRGTKIRPAGTAYAGFAMVFWIPAWNALITLGRATFVIFFGGIALVVIGSLKALPCDDENA